MASWRQNALFGEDAKRSSIPREWETNVSSLPRRRETSISSRLCLALLLPPLFCFIALFAESADAEEKAKPLSFAKMETGEIDRLLNRKPARPFLKRMQFLSRFFLGVAYGFDPLGEGEAGKLDHDPTFRLDRLDCLTFLEVLWGLTNADSLKEARNITQKMRYDKGLVNNLTRHHFSWAQWIVANEKAGYVENVTQKLFPKAAKLEAKRLTKPEDCKGKTANLCHRLAIGETFPKGVVKHWLLPIDEAIARFREIPQGAFLFIALVDRPHLPYRINHTGFVVKDKKGRKIFRHASRHHGKIVDVPLVNYLAMLKEKAVKWPVAGIIILMPKPSVDFLAR